MKIETKIAVCQCCKTNSEINYGIEDYSNEPKDLRNYANFNDFYTYSCPVCGNISFDLSRESDAKLYLAKKDDEIFKDIISNKFCEGYETNIVEDYLNLIPINEYIAYAYMLEGSQDKQIYFRALNRSIQLLEASIVNYKEAISVEGDETDMSNLRKLSRRIRQYARKLSQKFVEEFSNYETDNAFLKLIYAEHLGRLGEKDETYKAMAYKVVEEVDNSVEISIPLREYVKAQIKKRFY